MLENNDNDIPLYKYIKYGMLENNDNDIPERGRVESLLRPPLIPPLLTTTKTTTTTTTTNI